MVLADALVVVAGLPRGSDAVPPRHPAGHRRGLARIDATCPAPWTTVYLKLIADQPAIVSRARALPIIENAWMFITSIPRTAKPRSTSRDAIRAGASTGAGVTSPNRAIDSPSRFRGADDDQISAMRRLSLQGFQLFWRWKSGQRGRPRLPADLRRRGPAACQNWRRLCFITRSSILHEGSASREMAARGFSPTRTRACDRVCHHCCRRNSSHDADKRAHRHH
jgi:hypothetical protein